MTAIATEPTAIPSRLVDEMEREARKRAQALEDAAKLPVGFTAHYYPPRPSEERESRRMNAALMLADSAETYVALTKGQAVPRRRLRPEYLQVLERWPEG